MSMHASIRHHLEHHGSEHHPQGVKEAFQEQNQGGGNGDWQPRFGSHPSSSIRYEFEPFLHVLVMIYKKGFAYDNTKPKYDRTLYDLKKLKRQLRRIKAALHGMNLEAGEDEDEDEKFATLQKWKHAGRNVVLFRCCFGLKAFFVLVWATIYQELYIP
ncbi:uncharacterized protein [Malus domestica]|uniref:uncharacterized protein isoform X1 n=1 Tax=Malus domestica TaxID=3750 RepID=UPI0039772511